MNALWKQLAVSAASLALFHGSAAGAELKDLKVLYVGEPTSRRAGEFKGFLKRNVAQVELAERARFDVKSSEPFDVVLLDWPQRGEQLGGSSPFGELSKWEKPTVFIGSAGLHMAVVWKIKGGSG